MFFRFALVRLRSGCALDRICIIQALVDITKPGHQRAFVKESFVSFSTVLVNCGDFSPKQKPVVIRVWFIVLFLFRIPTSIKVRVNLFLTLCMVSQTIRKIKVVCCG